jgi:hypothetical protein
MKKTWKNIASVLPGPIVLWAGQWFDLFSRTHLAYPQWVSDAENTALAIGVFTAVLICSTLKNLSNTRLRRLAGCGFVLTIALFVACWAIWFYLGKAMPSADAMFWQDVWKGLYIAAMVFLVATISGGVLSAREETNNVFWIIIAGVLALVVIIAIIAAYLYMFP